MTTIANGCYGPKASELNKASKTIEIKQAFCYFFVCFSAEVCMLIFLIVMIPDSIEL